jgi:hypothetical protein
MPARVIAAAGVVELADRSLALRPGPPLVALDRGKARDAIARAQRLRKQRQPRAARADEIDLRGGDPARELEAFRIGLGPGDLAGQGRDLTGAGGIVAGRDAQAVAARVLRRPRLAGAGPRPGAGAGIAPVGLAPACAGEVAAAGATRRGGFTSDGRCCSFSHEGSLASSRPGSD